MAGYGKTLFVAGGSGFVGTNVCKEGVRTGFKVVSLSRRGRPAHLKEKWVDQVDWVQADVQDPDAYVSKLQPCDALVSCIGKFGTGADSSIFRANADTNITLAHLAHRECDRLAKYVYISAQQYSARVQYPFRAFFNSKLKAEEVISTLFPKNYLVFRPNFVYGWRHVAGPVWLPTQVLGAPLKHVLQPIADYCENTKIVVPPMSVNELAHVAVLGCTVGRDVHGVLPTVRVQDIMEREAQGRALDDYLQPYLRHVDEETRRYFEETNYVEKYGLLGEGKKYMEQTMIRSRQKLNKAYHRPEFTNPTRSVQYLVHSDLTPGARLLEEQRAEQEYLEGREVQLLLEEKQRQEAEDGERRLLGEDVPPCQIALPGWRFERDPPTPHREAVPDMKKLKQLGRPGDGVTPTDEDWKAQRSTPLINAQSLGGR